MDSERSDSRSSQNQAGCRKAYIVLCPLRRATLVNVHYEQLQLPVVYVQYEQSCPLPVVYVHYGDGKVVCNTGQEVAFSVQAEHRQKVIQH